MMNDEFACSERAEKCLNPIRSLVFGLKMNPNPDYEMVHLSLGDPTAFGYLGPPETAIDTLIEMARDPKSHGYVASYGQSNSFITPSQSLLTKYMNMWYVLHQSLNSHPRQNLDENRKYVSMADAAQRVPVLHCSALTKRFLVPGWRMGWIVVCDKFDLAPKLRQGLRNLTGKILGPNTVIQHCIPRILEETDEKFHNFVISTYRKNRDIAMKELSNLRGITLSRPTGAMYLIFKVDFEKTFRHLKDDLTFCMKMISAVSVFCLPLS
ncbi:hypothetical protein Ciccas_008658, partial [Cichlidogyrus casuarinus]